MARNLFSIPIFFIVFRETLEASIIVSVLLGLVEQIVRGDHAHSPHHVAHAEHDLAALPSDGAAADPSPADEKNGLEPATPDPAPAPATSADDPLAADPARNARLIRKLRWQIFLGALAGFFIALAIGAAFIAVWFTKAADLWERSETLWEGIFSLIAALLIFVMGVTMLKMDRAKAKWKVKLQLAFEGKAVDRKALTGKWVLFVLPFITVLREGMEAVVFVGGVSLGQPATSIPIATLVGILCGLICGYIIYAFASRTTLSLFLIVMTNFLLLIGAGLFSKSVASFERNAYNVLLGAEGDDAGGDGPGSYDVVGNVWHLDCCNPGNTQDGQGWNIFAALFGWTNSASVGTVLSYVFYWFAVVAVLVYLKFSEGRTTLLGRESAVGHTRRARRETKAGAA